MKDNYANNIETFNECTMILLLYCMMGMTDFVGDPETRSLIGFAFIFIVCLYAGILLSIMLGGMCKDVFRRVKRWFIHRQHRKKLAA